MISTNLNINSNNRVYKYLVDYSRNNIEVSNNNFRYVIDSLDNYNMVQLYNLDYHNIYRENNVWKDLNSYRTLYIPSTIKTSTITLHIPRYNDNNQHSLAVYFLNRDRKICLGDFLVRTTEYIADYLNNDYYESISFVIPDIISILYDDDWREFRETFLSNLIIDNLDIIIELHPISSSLDCYIETPNYEGSYNVINLDDSRNLKLETSINIPYLNNDIYLGSSKLEDINKYFSSHYRVSVVDIDYEIVLKDNNNIYKYIQTTSDEINIVDEFNIVDWSYFIEGLVILCSMNIRYDDNSLTLFSNEIPVTEEVYKYLIKKDIPSNINLNEVNMYNYRIDVVNKVEKNIVNIEGISDNKSNLIKPIFIKTYDSSNITIHPQVTESICINLNNYKSSVNIFYIKIEGIEFSEDSRISSGVVFKINGSKLPNKTTSGLYYILNEDSELVTTGNYNYIQ